MASIPEKVKDNIQTHQTLPWKFRLFSVPTTEKIFFVQHLGVMLKAGISLATALKTLAEQTSSKQFKFILTNIHESVNQGQSFAKTLSLYPKVFSELFVNMLHAGEVSGKYEEVLEQLYLQMKKTHELKNKVRGAMMYPIIVIIAMIVIGTGMLIFVIPKLTSIFDEVNVELPLATRILIGISGFSTTYGIWVLMGLFILFGILTAVFKREKPKYALHTFLLILPIFGSIIHKINIAKFARTLSSLLKTDISIIESFKITARVLGNRPYRKAMEHAAETVRLGKSIENALKQYPKLFPSLITQMVLVGEETGSLDVILKELADFYEEDIDQIMENLPSIIEPILMILLGIAVGGMAVALIMPLYSLTQAI